MTICVCGKPLSLFSKCTDCIKNEFRLNNEKLNEKTKEKTKNKNKCSICREYGHNSRSCKKK